MDLNSRMNRLEHDNRQLLHQNRVLKHKLTSIAAQGLSNHQQIIETQNAIRSNNIKISKQWNINSRKITNINDTMNRNKIENNKSINNIEFRVQRNTVQVDDINTTNIKNDAKYFRDTPRHENGMDWKVTSYFIFSVCRKRVSTVQYLFNVNKKPSQLFVELNNYYFIDCIDIEFKQNCLNWKLVPSPECPDIIEVGQAKSINKPKKFPNVREIYDKFHNSGQYLNLNTCLYTFNYIKPKKQWKTFTYNNHQRPKSHLKTPLWAFCVVGVRGRQIRSNHDPYKLFSCGEENYWQNPNNYYNNNVKPEPINIAPHLMNNMQQVDLGFAQLNLNLRNYGGVFTSNVNKDRHNNYSAMFDINRDNISQHNGNEIRDIGSGGYSSDRNIINNNGQQNVLDINSMNNNSVIYGGLIGNMNGNSNMNASMNSNNQTPINSLNGSVNYMGMRGNNNNFRSNTINIHDRGSNWRIISENSPTPIAPYHRYSPF